MDDDEDTAMSGVRESFTFITLGDLHRLTTHHVSQALPQTTMSTYLYELPTTGAISFNDFCLDKSHSYAAEIAGATQARQNLRAALKESKRAEGERDFLRLVKVSRRTT